MYHSRYRITVRIIGVIDLVWIFIVVILGFPAWLDGKTEELLYILRVLTTVFLVVLLEAALLLIIATQPRRDPHESAKLSSFWSKTAILFTLISFIGAIPASYGTYSSIREAIFTWSSVIFGCYGYYIVSKFIKELEKEATYDSFQFHQRKNSISSQKPIETTATKSADPVSAPPASVQVVSNNPPSPQTEPSTSNMTCVSVVN